MRISIVGTTDEMVDFLSNVTVDEWFREGMDGEEVEDAEPMSVVFEPKKTEAAVMF